jgi:hypothetical protein
MGTTVGDGPARTVVPRSFSKQLKSPFYSTRTYLVSICDNLVGRGSWHDKLKRTIGKETAATIKTIRLIRDV